MHYDEFMGQVQDRAHLSSTGEALKAARATLGTLGERLAGGEAADLAAQLPDEVGRFLESGGKDERTSFDLGQFFARVARREGCDESDAAHHARAVMSVVRDAVTPGEIADLRAQLPDEYAPLC
ncbi:MAG: DUF2267 domain-containing protein [Planctomycetota bacterium]